MKTITVGITVQKLRDFGNISEAIKYAQEQYGEYPSKPSKPNLKHGHSSVEAKQYVSDLEAWEKGMVEYNKQKSEYQERSSLVNEVIEDFIKDEAGLDTVPETSRGKVWSKAWSDGHSNGYSEVYGVLCSLVDLFN